MCINYELRHECENYYFTLGRTIDPSFKMGNKEKSKEKEQDEEVTLIINKRGQWICAIIVIAMRMNNVQ